MKWQIDRHANDDRAKQSALPEEPNHRAGGREKTRVFPAIEQVPLRHGDLRYDHGVECGAWRVLQSAFPPRWQSPWLLGGKKSERVKTVIAVVATMVTSVQASPMPCLASARLCRQPARREDLVISP